MHGMFRLCSTFAVCAALAGAAAAQDAAPEAWDARFYDPNPAAGDLILPMPCAGAMAFRPVEIESIGLLDDMQVELGYSGAHIDVLDDRRFDNIAGSFTPPDGEGRRLFYIGKYEVTRSQYDTLAAECPEPSMRGREPVVEVSWFDAVRFAQRYTEWLMREAPDRLPKGGELSGFLRLPTETEWEFAARGGMAVSSIDFVAGVFPMPDGDPSSYVWFQGSRSAAGRLHPVGLLKPNPLGLYDILGNASEMILEPFRLNRRGRLHGQPGGFVIRGGDFLVPEEQTLSAQREELPYYDQRSGAATKLRQLGFRLVLTAPAIVSAEHLAELQLEYAALPAADPGRLTAEREAAALDSLDGVMRDAADERVAATLRRVSRDLKDAITERNEARDRAIRLLINLGAFFGQKLRTDRLRLDSVGHAIDDVAVPAMEEMRRLLVDSPDAAETLARAEARIAEMNAQRDGLRAEMRIALENYADAVFTVAADYSGEIIGTQLAALEVELRARKAAPMIAYVRLFVQHMEQYREGRVDTDAWLRDLTR